MGFEKNITFLIKLIFFNVFIIFLYQEFFFFLRWTYIHFLFIHSMFIQSYKKKKNVTSNLNTTENLKA